MAKQRLSPSRRRVSLLKCDPDLGADLEEEERLRAERSLPAAAITLAKGSWLPDRASPASGHLGYLVACGILIRRVEVREGRSAELLGPGDLLRPWQEDASSFCRSSWEVLDPATVIVLEPPLAQQLSHWPPVVARLVGRSIRRARWLAADAAVADNVGVEERVLLLFWQLAEVWGTRETDGISLEVDLPHRVIAELIGARRPTVSTALSTLQAKRRLTSPSRGVWHVHGPPPC